MVGGFLVAAAAVAVFAAYLDAAGGPDRSWVVASGEVAVGQPLELADLAVAAVDLPPELAGRAFDDPEALVGAVALAPLSRYDLVLASHVGQGRGAVDHEELSFAIEASRAVGGALRRGDRVDVIAAYRDGDGLAEVIATDVEVLDAGEADTTIGTAGDLTLTVGVADRAAVLAIAHAVANAELLVVRTTGREPGEAGPTRFRPDLDDDLADDGPVDDGAAAGEGGPTAGEAGATAGQDGAAAPDPGEPGG
ncbi:MAG: RcpC/CpaB family pilus assembly protein [Egibacteraceae bacterium]